MQMRWAALGVLILGALAPVQAQTSTEGGPHAGTRSAEISGNLIYGASDNSSGLLTIQLGQYASPQLEFGAALGLSFENDPAQSVKLAGGGTGVQASSATTSGNVGALVRYHFPQQFSRSHAIPYLALYPNYTFINFRGSKDQHFLLIPAAGVDIYLHPQQSFVVELSAPTSVTHGRSTRAELNFGLKTFF